MTRESLVRGGPCYGYGESQDRHIEGCPGYSMGKAQRSRMCAKEYRIRKNTCSGYRGGQHVEDCTRATKGTAAHSKECRRRYLQMLEHCTGYARGLHVPSCEGRSLASSQLSSECGSARSRVYHYGLSPEAFLVLLESQNGLCDLCETDSPGGKGWVVDHNHTCCSGIKSCGKCVRAILCGNCNAALGFADDDPGLLRRMAAYAEAHATSL